MNKLVLSGGIVNLDKYTEDSDIIVKDDSILNSFNLALNANLNIEVEENKRLIMNMFSIAINQEDNISITLKKNSSILINISFITTSNYKLNINTTSTGDNTCNIVNIRGVNEENGTTSIVMNGEVKNSSKGTRMSEYAKIINHSNSDTVIIPNLLVDIDDVEANHGATIGPINNKELFYLMSKGLNKKASIKLIEEGFILSIMDEESKGIIKNVLMGR